VHDSTAAVAAASRREVVPGVPEHACPASPAARAKLRGLAAAVVAPWKSGGVPAEIRSAAGLRAEAERLVEQAGLRPEHVGWTMVTIVSEFWRDRLAHVARGRRLLLLPDCPAAADDVAGVAGVPRVCGPACGITRIWTAARDAGWVVQSTDEALSAIGGLLTGQYDGVLGVAKLSHLEKAFAMLPAFALPVAAVPYAPPSRPAAAGADCAAALARSAIDVDWVLGLVGGAAGEPVADGGFLPLLREAAELFTPAGLAGLAARLNAEPAFGLGAAAPVGDLAPLDAAAALGGGFVTRGGKFLRPFVSLAAFDAVQGDRTVAAAPGYAADPALARDAARAAAVAIEVFHKASLVHDDIEDGDRVRYGRATLHEECGVASAINVGDYLLGVGYRIIAGLPGLDPATTRDLVAILSAAHVRLARGQGAELWWRDAADRRLSAADSLAMYGLKTSPAFEAAIALGVRLAGVEPATAGPLDRFALHVGTGFQILNDLKDWAGDLENERGAAGDLLGGRPTLMWALALEGLDDRDARRLRGVADEAAAAADSATVARCLAAARELYERAGVFARAEALVVEERSRAVAAVSACRLRRLREVLEFLLDLAVPRDAAGPFRS
jgi:geranylgeranyl pyrophosphate synthase